MGVAVGNHHNAIVSVLEHAPLKAVNKLPGVNLHVDDPNIRVEEFFGTDGEIDVFVFDASVALDNITLLSNFDSGEDFFLFENVEGRDLVVGDLGEGLGVNFVLFHGTGEGANILAFGVPHEQEAVEEMLLPFDGQLVFDDLFA